jgi:hypothetical protein
MLSFLILKDLMSMGCHVFFKKLPIWSESVALAVVPHAGPHERQLTVTPNHSILPPESGH